MSVIVPLAAGRACIADQTLKMAGSGQKIAAKKKERHGHAALSWGTARVKPAHTELNSSSELPEKRRHLFRAAQLRIFFYSPRSEK